MQLNFLNKFGLVLLAFFLLITPANNALGATFPDVSSDSPFSSGVNYLSQRGIIQGYPDGRFHPDQPVSRIEFLKMVLLASNHQVATTYQTGIPFPDVPTNSWYAPYIQLAISNNYISGYADGTFKPNNTVSRVEAIKMLLNAYHIDLNGGAIIQGFSDVYSTDWYFFHANYARQQQLLDACHSDKLCPNNKLNRGEVASMIYRLADPSGVPTTAVSLESLSRTSTTARSSIIILVDPNISSPSIFDGFTTWTDDLVNEGYNVQVKTNNWTNVVDIRTYLQSQYSILTPRLEGVILVGNIPYAHMFVHTCNVVDGCMDQSAISYTPYQDLDGIFRKTNPSFPEAYSEHTGDVNNEIWVSQMPMYGNYEITQTAIVQYLEKNHDYRTNFQTNKSIIQIEHHQRATTLIEAQNIINALMRGEYGIVPSNHRSVNQYFFFHNTSGFGTPEDGYNALSGNSTYDFLELDDHADYNQIGLINSDWLSSNVLNAAFIFFTGCNTAKLDAPTTPIAVQSLYHSNSKAVVLFGTTITSGGLGQTSEGYFTKAILKKLFEGENIGSSFQYHFNLPLLSPWSNDYEFHHAPVFLGGDGTLKLKI